ncbi:hypothetical protein DL766_003574 [Monosporascus sp. MC13-8B]|uniref:Mid2 domain-containing protein n=1 Tax=Monosporascus cannonballus TaxID=155416 RepID=A0ABY0H8E6_9PEZI|nr:hypothetical protein DL763_006809 [Monosporascus cannonballus]RYO87559.1 hypothetical protein DL762_004205 [Monosporascus cannonballus]RYP33269.1 hypothetical protein DL766_003574 [Monosporascus sp. MC13-8B]
MLPTVLLAASFGIAVQALALDGMPAKRTEAIAPTSTRPFPSEITIPPSALDLKKRQELQTVLVGPDNTCGYISGRAGAVYSCNVQTAQCAFVSTAGFGAVACCNEYDCGLRVACLDYGEIYLSSSCDYGCLQDTFTVKCTSTLYPYCGTISFFDGVMDYYCDSLSGSVVQKAETTYSGQTDERTFTPVVVTDTTSSTGPRLTSARGSVGFTAQDTTDDPSPTGITDDPSPTDSSPSRATTSDAPPPASAGGGSSNIGAIVGGVVGGVVGIALIALLAFFLIRRNKNRNQLQQPQQQLGYPPMQQQQQAGLEPQGPPPGHGSMHNPGYPPPQQGAYLPGYYQDQNKPAGFVNLAAAPDRNQSTSPASLPGSQLGDNMSGMQPTSPTSTVHSNYPPNQYGAPPQHQQHHYPSGVPPTVHEAHSNVVGQPGYHDNHHGQFHELPEQPMR